VTKSKLLHFALPIFDEADSDIVPIARQMQPQIGRHNGPRKTKNAPAAIKAKPMGKGRGAYITPP
jgi:hypothetical protein